MLSFLHQKAVKALLITLLMVTTVSAVGHSAEYGSASHTHDGKACIIKLLSEDDPEDIFILSPAFYLPAIIYNPVFAQHKSSMLSAVIHLSVNARAPPA